MLDTFLESLRGAAPPLGVVAATVLAVAVVARAFRKHPAAAASHGHIRNLLFVLFAGAGAVGLILVLPVSEAMRSNLLSVFGLVVSAAITLSSTTFVANTMAGFLLRAVGNARPGDFLKVGENFGRVSEQGLFHTEIQTPESNLTTLPNLYLVTNPVTVYSGGGSGTVVAATVSLGYDVPHHLVERILVQAGRESELRDPFVQILDLGDFSITYRCAGFLDDTRRLLAKETLLRANMLDQLHDHGVEIVSPTFMNQRRLPDEKQFIPESPARWLQDNAPDYTGPRGEMIFDKAERAASLERLRRNLETVETETKDLEARLAEVKDEDAPRRARLGRQIQRNRLYKGYLENRLAMEEKNGEEEKAGKEA